MPDRDPYYAKGWHGFRRETVLNLFGLACIVLLQYGYLLYSYFVWHESMSGGTTSVVILIAGTISLLASGWFTVKTLRSKRSRRPMWWMVGLATSGMVIPIGLLYLLL